MKFGPFKLEIVALLPVLGATTPIEEYCIVVRRDDAFITGMVRSLEDREWYAGHYFEHGTPIENAQAAMYDAQLRSGLPRTIDKLRKAGKL